MIRVALAPEPPAFEDAVRRPGLDAIAELVGEKPIRPRPGPRRAPVAARREEIPSDAFPPLWRGVLEEMLCAYARLCAYTSLYIERVTGAPSVDHVLPRSRRWDRVYAWDNYRLACALMNARKGATDDVLDPFEVVDGWFALEFVECQVIAQPGLDGARAAQVCATIERLGLNDPECLAARREYVESYEQGDIRLDYLRRRAPFIAREMRRQGRLRPEDQSRWP